MTSRRGGSERYKSPPSPPSSGSEDNGFTNRPRVAGLYVKNLSREELDELAKEGIYGPTGNPNDRPRDGGSQRSLNLPGSSRDGQDYSRRVTSRTPQPPRRSGVGVRYREPSELSEDLTRRDHHGSFPLERGWPRRLEDRPGQGSPERSIRGSSEFPAAWREPFARPSVTASLRGSSIDVRFTGEEARMPTGPRRLVESPRRPPEELPPRIPFPMGTAGDQGRSAPIRRSPPPYAGLSPVENTEELRRIPPRPTARSRQVDRDSPYERPRSPLSVDKDKDSGSSRQASPCADINKTEDPVSPPRTPVTEKPSSPKSKRSESSPTKESGSRMQDSTRLRPPLVGTAGTSADSGTGDSGSAEIQVDAVTPQASSSNILDANAAKMNGRSPGSRTPSSKGGKQTVKPFTKESLDRLENKTVQLVRDYGFQPKRKMSVEDGAVLPNKFEPFPTDLYGRPLEEIDNFIYDEVSPRLWIVCFCVFSAIPRFARRSSYLRDIVYIYSVCLSVYIRRQSSIIKLTLYRCIVLIYGIIREERVISLANICRKFRWDSILTKNVSLGGRQAYASNSREIGPRPLTKIPRRIQLTVITT